ncbi:Tn3 family transposase [Streptomyces sp. NPDC017936]|uniref:Tn3 family transposase n=1 Tax=Streptomyces sp. NPDC017936 TaxID=3365016 RepID=UPI00379F71CE
MYRRSLGDLVIFHNALDIAQIVRQLQEDSHVVDPEDLARISPYLTEHIRRFGEYPANELGLEPEAYDPHLDVGFSPLRGDGPGADGYGQAAWPSMPGHCFSGSVMSSGASTMHTHACLDRRV